MQILSIASGKGGVGKSLVAANLSIALANAGKKVVLVDLDLGGSNLHLILGNRIPEKGIGTFLNRPFTTIDEIIYETDYTNLLFIPGEAELPGAANISTTQKKKLINKLLTLDADYLVADLGAGTSFNTMDMFLLSGQGLIVTTPTLTATLNAYLFLKNAVFRIMSASFTKKSPAYEYLETLRKDGESLQKVFIPRLVENIKKIDPVSYEKYMTRINGLKPRLILNMLEDPKDAAKAGKLRHSCKEYLGINLDHLGIMYRDELQTVALNSRLPIVSYKPKSVLSQAIFRIADKIIEHEDDISTRPLTFDESNTSFQVAEMEAEVDFNTKMQSLEELLDCGALTQGDLIDTIKSQQFELNMLRRENRFYKNSFLKNNKK
jgi:flagellar biosynthesis protein FlhG